MQPAWGREIAAPARHALRQEQARPPTAAGGGRTGAHPDGAEPVRGVEARQPHRGPHPRRVGRGVDGSKVRVSKHVTLDHLIQSSYGFFHEHKFFLSRKDSPHINRIVHPYDWTFTPAGYRGTLTPEVSWKIEPSNKGGVSFFLSTVILLFN